MRAPLQLIATESGTALAEGVARELGLEVQRLNTRRFVNGELECDPSGLQLRDRDAALFWGLGASVSDALLELLLALRALCAGEPRRLTAVVPYLPYARSDHPEQPGRSVPARLIAELIERAGARRVVAFDLHSAQIAGFFDTPPIELSAVDGLVQRVQQWGLERLVVASPDLGGAKRADAFAARLAAPLVIVRKRREHAAVRALELAGDVAGRPVLLVDDEIATGSTIASAAELLVARGAREVSVAATHAVLVGDAIERLQGAPVRRVLLTDTIARAHPPFPKLELISVAVPLARALRELSG